MSRSIAVAALGAGLLLAPVAQAAHNGDNGLRGAGKGRPPKVLGTHPKEEAEEKQLLEAPEEATQTSLASELGSSGSVDPLSGLGIRNPVRSLGAGRITAVFVTEGQPVEYGQPLFAIER